VQRFSTSLVISVVLVVTCVLGSLVYLAYEFAAKAEEYTKKTVKTN